MKKIKILILLTVAILVLCGAGCQWFGKTEKTNEANAPQTEQKIEQKATLVIDDGTGKPQSFELQIKQDTKAFDLFKEACDKAGLKLDYSESSMGVLINAIGDKVNGQEGKYWLFYVNGEMASVAADKQEVKAGDKIEFKFDKYQ